MFRRFVPPSLLGAIADYFKKNPKNDNATFRERHEKLWRNRHGGWSYPSPDDARSAICARRRAQIEAGQIRHENGLIRPEDIIQNPAGSVIRCRGSAAQFA